MSYNPYAYTGNANEVVTDRFAHSNGQIPPQNQGQDQMPTQQQQQRGFNGGNAGYNPMGGQPQPQQQQSQQQQQGQGQQGFPFQDPRNTMAFQIGQSAFNNFIGQDNFNQFQENVNKVAGSPYGLSHYFQVSTIYVLNKIKQILFPFANTNNWQRIIDNNSSSGNNNNGINYLPPMEDVNSPDLYIPIMGLVTYILIWNTQQGLQGSFNPENLYYKLSSILAFVGLDLFILKLGLYLLVNTNSPTTSITELTCYVGYKFVPLTLALFFPLQPLWISMLGKIYLFIAFGVFLLRSVKFNLFNNSNDEMGSVNKSTVKKCNYFLFVYGFLWQSVLMWLMG